MSILEVLNKNRVFCTIYIKLSLDCLVSGLIFFSLKKISSPFSDSLCNTNVFTHTPRCMYAYMFQLASNRGEETKAKSNVSESELHLNTVTVKTIM